MQQETHIINGKREILNYRVFMKIFANSATLPIFVSEYLTEITSEILTVEQQIESCWWILEWSIGHMCYLQWEMGSARPIQLSRRGKHKDVTTCYLVVYTS